MAGQLFQSNLYIKGIEGNLKMCPLYTGSNNSLVLWFMVVNATFNNKIISWRSLLLVDETGVHGENH
jgi:hypothetical protein